MYPVDQTEYNNLKSALERLTLNDSSVTVHRDSSLALGAGWRGGFYTIFICQLKILIEIISRLGALIQFNDR